MDSCASRYKLMHKEYNFRRHTETKTSNNNENIKNSTSYKSWIVQLFPAIIKKLDFCVYKLTSSVGRIKCGNSSSSKEFGIGQE